MTQEDGSTQITNTGIVKSTFVSDGTGGVVIVIYTFNDDDKIVIDYSKRNRYKRK